MAARGAECKAAIEAKLLEVFAGAFKNGKEIRIPMQENGETVEIKVTLTAAKDVVGGSAEVSDVTEQAVSAEPLPWEEQTPIEQGPSEDEKKRLEKLIAGLF